MPTKPVACQRKVCVDKSMKKLLRKMIKMVNIFLLLIVLILVYLVCGVVISYRRQPAVSQEYQASFHPEDCYSDTVSCDRAWIVEDNVDGLVERLSMIEQAKERIILSTFEFRADESGKDMLAVLLAAAKRGVKIQILSDGMAAILRMYGNPYFLALADMDTVEIKIYNRINVLLPWRTMGRLHDKYVITDDDLYLLGGRNTYDYFLGDNGYKNYDRDVLVYTTEPENEESSIHQLERYFDSVWALKDCKTFHPRNGKKVEAAKEELEERCLNLRAEYPFLGQRQDYEAKTFPVNKITLLYNPTHVYAKEPTLFYALIELMKYHGNEEITIHTPYIICNQWMYDSLKEVCDRNPGTILMTNSAANNGNPFGASDYLKNKGKLLDTGLTIYEYEGGISYHGKSISIGNRLSVVGSFNMDMRSVYLDTELMLVIDSEKLNDQLRGIMEDYEETAVKVLDTERYEIPANVKRVEFTDTRRKRIELLNHFNWLRFLM